MKNWRKSLNFAGKITAVSKTHVNEQKSSLHNHLRRRSCGRIRNADNPVADGSEPEPAGGSAGASGGRQPEVGHTAG